MDGNLLSHSQRQYPLLHEYPVSESQLGYSKTDPRPTSLVARIVADNTMQVISDSLVTSAQLAKPSRAGWLVVVAQQLLPMVFATSAMCRCQTMILTSSLITVRPDHSLAKLASRSAQSDLVPDLNGHPLRRFTTGDSSVQSERLTLLLPTLH